MTAGCEVFIVRGAGTSELNQRDEQSVYYRSNYILHGVCVNVQQALCYFYERPVLPLESGPRGLNRRDVPVGADRGV